MANNPPLLELRNIQKNYGENQVLKGVSFSLCAGEVLGLIGENGAGKSTLMNILFGMPVVAQTGGFTGDYLLNGQKVCLKSPQEAIANGLGMVHQEFMLVPEMMVYENIKLNREPTHPFLNRCLSKKWSLLDRKKMRLEAQIALKKIGLNIDEWLTVAGLPVGHKQFIEIARELDKSQTRLLVFDEPTAVLTESEADILMATIKHLAKDLGLAIIFISHRLREIKEICDSVVVLRDGETVGIYKNDKISVEQMAELMVGRKVDLTQREFRTLTSEDFLEVKNLSVKMPGEEVKGISFSVKKGEIFGFGGLAGQGKMGIANGIFGLYPAQGEVSIGQQKHVLGNVLTSLKNGFGFLCEDRRSVGLLLDQSIEENICVTATRLNPRFLCFGFLKFLSVKKICAYAKEVLTAFDIRCQSLKQHTRRLSGGNQQKVCLARVLAANPKVLFVSEPTRGVDIGAKKLILDKLVELAKSGMTIVLTSSELVELRLVCDRIAIISQGEIAEILAPTDSDQKFGMAFAK